MARCRYCRQEMRTALSRSPRSRRFPRITIQSEVYEPVRYGQEQHIALGLERCPDCGVAHGGAHHPGCDIEECPCCFGQIISGRYAEPTRNVVWIE